MTEINGIRLPFLPAGGVNELGRENLHANRQNPDISFRDIFDEELNKIKFSAHAQTRMESRDIFLNVDEIQRLSQAFTKAGEKGANESLILLDEKAFVVSIPNRTVITVIDKPKLSETVFTNIDSAVIA